MKYTDTQRDSQPARQPASQTHTQTDKQAGRQTDRQTDRERQTDRQTDSEREGGSSYPLPYPSSSHNILLDLWVAISFPYHPHLHHSLSHYPVCGVFLGSLKSQPVSPCLTCLYPCSSVPLQLAYDDIQRHLQMLEYS